MSWKVEKPKRAVELTVKIGGDSESDVKAALEQILFEFDKGCVRDIVSGSPSCGWVTEVKHNPGMTHDEYHRQLKLYLEYTGGVS